MSAAFAGLPSAPKVLCECKSLLCKGGLLMVNATAARDGSLLYANGLLEAHNLASTSAAAPHGIPSFQ